MNDQVCCISYMVFLGSFSLTSLSLFPLFVSQSTLCMILLSNWYMYYGAGAGGVNFKLPPPPQGTLQRQGHASLIVAAPLLNMVPGVW